MMHSSSNVSGSNTTSNRPSAAEEMVPLRHSSSLPLHHDDQDPAEKNKDNAISSQRILLQPLFWIVFALFGWYFPRFLIHRETAIAQKSPPYQLVGETIVKDFLLDNPLTRPATVDSLLLKSSALYLPFIFIVVHAWYSTPVLLNTTTISPSVKLQLVATVVSAFGMAVGLSEGTTVMIKLWVQRRRPNFYALCGFDVASKQCTASLEEVREANFSFPSGHSSLVCCGMTFLMWYLNGHNHTNGNSNSTRPHSLSRLYALAMYTLLPYAWALFVAASRLEDHWHHPSDVVAGLCLGFATCTTAYHYWYPPIWSHAAGIPRAMLLIGNTGNDGTTTAPSTPARRLQSQSSSAGSEIQMTMTKGV